MIRCSILIILVAVSSWGQTAIDPVAQVKAPAVKLTPGNMPQVGAAGTPASLVNGPCSVATPPASGVVCTQTISAPGFASTDTSHSGSVPMSGVTSGGFGFAAADAGAAKVLYIGPPTGSGTLLADGGVIPCGTLAASAAGFACHQLILAPSGGAVAIVPHLDPPIIPPGQANAQTYSTAVAPLPNTPVKVFCNGLLLAPGSDYTVAGQVVTITGAVTGLLQSPTIMLEYFAAQ